MDGVVVTTVIVATLVLYGGSFAIYRHRFPRSAESQSRRSKAFLRRYRTVALVLTACFLVVVVIGAVSSSTALFVVGFCGGSGSLMCAALAREELRKREAHAGSPALGEVTSTRFYLFGATSALLAGAAAVSIANGDGLVSLPLALGAALLAIYAGLRTRRRARS